MAATGAAEEGAAKQRVLLLYSGGLDTSCILVWLQKRGFEVQAFLADVGQPEDMEAARAKALSLGATKVHLDDLRENFVADFIVPAIQCNAIYENLYLLGTSLARPCIARRAAEVAVREGCKMVAHGATGKGNDQVRFELTIAALAPQLTVYAPWRDPEFFHVFKGRPDLLAFAEANSIPVVQTSAKPYSMDENLMHVSYEGGILEDPAAPYPEGMFRMTVDPEVAPDTAAHLTISFEKGVPVKVTQGDKVVTGLLDLFLFLNEIGGAHGVGRVDVVENRFVGMKSRGVYETPAGTILRLAHIGLEGLCVDREVMRLRNTLAAEFSTLVYNGFWFSPEMEFILHAVNKSQERVTGDVTLKLFKGCASIVSRASSLSLYNKNIASMDEIGAYNPEDAGGFIRINSLRLKAHAHRESHK